MNNKFIKFCNDIRFVIPQDWEHNSIKEVTKSPTSNNLILHIDFFKIPQIQALKSFQQAVKSSGYAFEIDFSFKNQFCEYRLITDYLKHICELNKIFDFNVPWDSLKVQLNAENSYIYFIDNKNLWESLEPKIEDINQALISFGLDKVELEFKFDWQAWENAEEIRNIKESEAQWEQEKLNSNVPSKETRQTPDFKNFSYRNKKNYVTFNIEQCFETFEKNVSISGQIFKRDQIKTKSEKLIVILSISDLTNAIKVKIFCSTKEQMQEVEKYVVGTSILVNGELVFDDYAKERVINSHKIMQIDSMKQPRQDLADNKRIELAARTNMSAMDGMPSAKEYVAIAQKLGHKALAIVDTDSVQAFPEFYYAAKKAGIKPIYGATFSAIEKSNKIIINPLDLELESQTYVVFDLETTGLSPRFNEIIEFGAAIVKNNMVIKKYQFFVKPTTSIPVEISKMTGITEADVANAIDQKAGIIKIREILEGNVAIAHNAGFDIGFVNEKIAKFGLEKLDISTIDTLYLSRMLNSKFKKHSLEDLARRLDIYYDSVEAHRADYDADVLAKVWISFSNQLNNLGFTNIKDLVSWEQKEIYNHQFPKEITVLAKNQAGLKELFKLLSYSSTENFHNGPRLFIEQLPKSSNILIGSSTLNSRLIDKLMFGTKQSLFDELKYYDYIEIPAIQNFLHYFNRGWSRVEVQHALKELIQEAKLQNKIVVGVSNCRYINAEDAKMHEIYINSKGIGGARHYLFKYRENNPIYPIQNYLTTNELKEQFKYLIDQDLIEELVVDNPKKIMDLIEDKIVVIKDKLYPPTFDDSQQKLPDLVWKRAKEIYGQNLPEIVEQRLHRELDPILKYGFDVVYWISHKLVSKSLKDGYLVGSRGSVGSSLVATMAGITEVNPLVAHYICKNCQYSEFFTDGKYPSGFDLPDKNCPKCSQELDKDGQTIPFETFLGFEADKVPDIDLNFSGEYQAIVHDEVRQLFGHDHSFRAGTISTIADKTAYGYVKAYEEERQKTYSNSFREFLASKLVGVKRTSGQHPGGIIVIPKEFDVEDFTPINFPANDDSSSWRTTHFDFHAIHDNVLKLDILGHDDPTAIKMLEELTQTSVHDIPKTDQKIISLFSSTDALGIKPEDISGETTGAQGIPEFGTQFVRQMLKTAKVNSFADLVSISGLSHGTDVWKGNAENLIVENNLSFKDVISCRDDIMSYLIQKGIEPKISFQIMEQVRKGNSINEQQEELLKKNLVPNWYIESMKKIKYMFPKAHATAYVMMAWRVAYYKLYHPLAYYATYFSTRADVSDIVTLTAGKNAITTKLKDFSDRQFERGETKLSTKEKDLIPILAIAEEMYARGYTIDNIKIGLSNAKNWQLDHERKTLIPPYTAIDGLGEAQAESIINALEKGDFMSIQDLSERTSLNQTLIQKMREMKILDHLDETNQMTLF